MVTNKKITYLVKLSITEGKLDAQKIAFIAKKLTRDELLEYYQLIRKKRQDEMVTVFTAVDMPKNMAMQLQKIFKNKDVLFEKDPAILAGLKVKFGDFIFDASFKHYLEKFKEQRAN